MNKKKMIIVLASVITLVGIGTAALVAQEKGRRAQMDQQELQTEEILPRSIEKSLSAAGTVSSYRAGTETVALSNLEVENVAVKVGDMVKEGDLLCTLNMESLRRALEVEERNISVGEAKNAISREAARRQLEDSIAGKNKQVVLGNKAINDAGEHYVKAAQEVLVLEQKLDTAKKQEAQKLSVKNAEESGYQDKKKKYEEKSRELQKQRVELDKAQARVNELESRLNRLKNAAGFMADRSIGEKLSLAAGNAAYQMPFRASGSGMGVVRRLQKRELKREFFIADGGDLTGPTEEEKAREPEEEISLPPSNGSEMEKQEEPESNKEPETDDIKEPETADKDNSENKQETESSGSEPVQPDSNKPEPSAPSGNQEEQKRLEGELERARAVLRELSGRVNELQLQLIPLEGAYNTAKGNYETALAAYNDAAAIRKSLEESLKPAKNQADSAGNSYENTVLEKQDTESVGESSVKAQQENLRNTILDTSNNLSSVQKEADKYREELEKGRVTASLSGIVTAVNVNPKDVYTGGAVVTIEDTSSYVVRAMIDEADISDLKEGMKVRIKTDATGEEELEGSIVFLSPTPVKAAQDTAKTAVTRASYEVRAAVETPNDRLRLGMLARLRIILDSRENVLAVPYSALMQEEGKAFIQVLEKEGGAPVRIPVEKGLENDYYVEIKSSRIKKGMKVVIPQETDSGSAEEIIENMGLLGGM